MDQLEQYGLPIVIVLAMAFLLWFGVGNEYNRRRGARFAQWVHDGVKPFLGKASIRWIGTSAFHIYVEQPPPPFKDLQVTVLLESRDMPFVWLMNRLLRRTDLLMVRCNLRRRPPWGLELYRPNTILAPDSRREAAELGWTTMAGPAADLLLAHPGGRTGDLVAKLSRETEAYWPKLMRLAVRRDEPHLMFAISAATFPDLSAHEIFSLVRRLAETTSEFAAERK